MMHEYAMRGRGTIVRGLVTAIDDTGTVQLLTVQTHEGRVLSGIEVLSPHGVASNAGQGAEVLLLAVEDDQGHYVALPASLFGQRLGGLPPGGAALYDDGGNKLVIPGDGSATLSLAALFRLLAQTASYEAAGGHTFHGPVTFTDDVTFQGEVICQKDVTVAGALHVGGAITGASFNGHS